MEVWPENSPENGGENYYYYWNLWWLKVNTKLLFMPTSHPKGMLYKHVQTSISITRELMLRWLDVLGAGPSRNHSTAQSTHCKEQAIFGALKIPRQLSKFRYIMVTQWVMLIHIFDIFFRLRVQVDLFGPIWILSYTALFFKSLKSLSQFDSRFPCFRVWLDLLSLRSYLGLALLISMAVFALMMWKVRAMADNTERTAGKKNEKREWWWWFWSWLIMMVLIMITFLMIVVSDDSCWWWWWWWWWNLHFIRLTRPLGTFLQGVTKVFWCNCRAPLKTGTALQETQLPACLSHPHRIQRNDHGLVADVLGNLFARRYAWVKSGVLFPACDVFA